MTPEKGCGRFQAVVTIPLVRSIPLRRVSEPGNEPVALENAPSGDTVPVIFPCIGNGSIIRERDR